MSQKTEEQIKEEFLNEIELIFDNAPDENIQTKIENGEKEYMVTSTDNVDQMEYYIPEIDENVKTDHNDEIVMYLSYQETDMVYDRYEIGLFYKEDRDKEEIKNELKQGERLRDCRTSKVLLKDYNNGSNKNISVMTRTKTHPFITGKYTRTVRTLKWFLNNFKGEFY